MAVLVCLAGVCGSCDGCGGASGAVRVDGPTPYVRCMAADPPDPFDRRVNGVGLSLEGRALRVQPPGTARIAAFAGPAPARAIPAGALEAVADGEPDLVLVLGDVGDSAADARATLHALSTVGAPAVVLAGGRDEAAVLDAAFAARQGEARKRVIDGRALRRLRIGQHELVPVSGAPGGRYGRSDGACGYDEDILKEVAGTLGAGGGEVARRWLVSWAAPAGWPAAAGLGEVDAGDRALARFAERIGAAGHGLFAWPRSGGSLRSGADPGAWSRRAPSIGGVLPPSGDEPVSPPEATWLLLTPEGPQWGGAEN